MRANEFIVEVLDSNPSKPSGIDDRWIVSDDGTTVRISSQVGEIVVQIYGNREYWVHVEFTRNGFAEITGEGNQFKVFEIVWWVLQKWMRSGPRPQWITFSSETKSRTGLYQRMISRFSAQYGYRSHELSDPEVPREIVDEYESIIDYVFVLSKIDNKLDKQDMTKGGAETSWSHGNEKITLQDILELTKHVESINLPINDNLKSKLIHWDGNPEEIERINQVTVSNQFPILIIVDEQGQIKSILDGNHRLHKAIRAQAKTIPAKLIKPSDLNDKAKRILHIGKQGVAEGSLSEIGYADKLNDANYSTENLLKIGKFYDKIEDNIVMTASAGSQKVYFLVIDGQVTAFLGFNNGYLTNIKNFTESSGVVRALIGCLVHKHRQKISISEDEPLTKDGLDWLIRLIQSPRGLSITDQHGNQIDTIALKQEWVAARKNGEPGSTGIVISENLKFGNKLRENEVLRESKSLLMPYNFYETEIHKQDVTKDILNELAPSFNDDNSGDNHLSLETIAKIIELQLGNKCTVVPGKNSKQSSFKITPIGQTKYSIRIWSTIHPRTKEPYPTYNTILFTDNSGVHAERAKMNTYANAITTAKLLKKNFVNEDDQNTEQAFAIHLSNLPRYFKTTDPLAQLVPERDTHTFAVHSDILRDDERAIPWRRTFAALTGKDYSRRVFAGYRPKKMPITSNTLIADMMYADFYYSRIVYKTPDEKNLVAQKYIDSMKLLNNADISSYKKPELLIPKS